MAGATTLLLNELLAEHCEMVGTVLDVRDGSGNLLLTLDYREAFELHMPKLPNRPRA